MKERQIEDPANERLEQIKSLYQWAKKNTDINKISPMLAIKFFDSEKESINSDLDLVFQVYNDIIQYAKENFHVGNFFAKDYANSILLKITEDHDVQGIREQLLQDQQIINPTFTKTSKIKIIQNELAKALNELSVNELPIDQLIDKVINSKKLEKNEALECIEKALKMGAVSKSVSGNLKL